MRAYGPVPLRGYWAQHGAGLIVGRQVDLMRASVDGFLGTQELASVVVPCLHVEAGRGVAVVVDRSQVHVLAPGADWSPCAGDGVGAVLDRGAGRTLRHICGWVGGV